MKILNKFIFLCYVDIGSINSKNLFFGYKSSNGIFSQGAGEMFSQLGVLEASGCIFDHTFCFVVVKDSKTFF